ncbi:DUF4112 domain-containing protein [Nostoc sp. NMS4]|uniref:DUF4112 domain-containing protein n=1 Tax=Nostoc sp. NMS4 TaxID=2815390 RepID=UPI0025DB4FC1|nr:DUF4112 domain-containing protein [Nostoc sp. NMS4]MBN3925750.1 DUF4112 domain-containing protein [Nostoc sp. NMS4]
MPDSSPRFSMIEPDAKAPTLKRLRQLSRLLDNVVTIPGTKIGFGLDPIIGLIPIGGDFLGVMFSSYIILEAARLGVSRATLGKMVLNVIIDGLVGTVPVLGDFFDFAWRANTNNIKLLEEYLKFPSEQKSADRWFIFAVLVGLLLISIALVALPVILIRILWSAFTGG